MTRNFSKPKFQIDLRWFVLFAWLCFLTSGSCDTVVLQLRNGDRLTGTLLSESTNNIVISNSWVKELSIPIAEISIREKIPSPAEVARPSTNSVTNAVANAKTISPSTDAQKKKPPIMQAKSWHGKIDIGMDLGFSEKNRQLYYGNAKIVYSPEKLPDEIKTFGQRFKNTFEYQATYGKTEDVLSANRMDGSSKTDFDLKKGIFLYNLFALGYDEIRTIDFQYEIGPGVGYHVITRSNLVLNAEVGVNYQVQNFRGNVQNERFFLRFAEDFSWKITQRLTLDEKLELLPSMDTFRSFRFRFESNLRYAFWQHFAITLSILNIYDTKPAPGIGRNDLQIRSMIGVNF